MTAFNYEKTGKLHSTKISSVLKMAWTFAVVHVVALDDFLKITVKYYYESSIYESDVYSH